jgi:hypothetical protein
LEQILPGRNWVQRIEKACEQYNATVHSATGLAPNEVTVDKANQVFRRLYKPWAKSWDLDKILKLGSHVRLRLSNRGHFVKSNVARNSAEVFVVGRIRLHPSGVKYKLFTLEERLPIAGTWNISEIVPIKQPQI